MKLRTIKHPYLSLWAINDDLDITRLKQQVSRLKQDGLQGVIFHPRNYTNQPRYLSVAYFMIVSELILYCKKINMSFWIYDENGWPSGTADGQVIQQNPQLVKQHVELRAGNIVGGLSHFTWNQQPYTCILVAEVAPSPIDRIATELFLKIVYEGYANGLTPAAFAYVSGFFSDEVCLPTHPTKKIPSIPWSVDLMTAHQERYQRSLIGDLPQIFATDEQRSQIRADFWELAAEFLGHNFYAILSGWCQKHDKRFIAHLKGEENMAFSVPFNGSPFQVLKNIDIPGVDALGRLPGNDYYPRIASSVAVQFHDGTSFCEVLGGAGWGLAPQDVVNYLHWLQRCHINHFCFHVAQYQLKGQAIQDWPPSNPFGLTWEPLFREVLASANVSKVSSAHILVIAPMRYVMSVYHPDELTITNRHNGSNQPDTMATRISAQFNKMVTSLTEQNINFDVIDEKLFEENYQVLNEHKIKVGQQTYTQILADPACWFRHKVPTLVEPLKLVTTNPKVQSTKTEVEWVRPRQTDWKISPDHVNLIPLIKTADNSYYFESNSITTQSWVLLASDKLTTVTINQVVQDCQLIGQNSNGQYLYRLANQKWQEGLNQLIIPQANVYLWLQGTFTVILRSNAPQYTLIPQTVRLTATNVVARQQPLLLHCQLHLVDPITKISLKTFSAAAVTLEIADRQLNFWSNNLVRSVDLAAGDYQVWAKLYPTTFNVYGPQRYLVNDPITVSPAQYLGHKNFIDPIAYPEKTLGNRLHYQVTELGALIVI